MNKLYSIEVKGKSGQTWSFNFYADSKYEKDWDEDGLIVYEIVNTIPEWAPIKLWCFFQDLFNFKNPFK